VHCGYRYLRMIDEHEGGTAIAAPRRVTLASIAGYRAALLQLATDTETFFESLTDAKMAQNNPAKKVKTSWGQYYDYEQLMEHAIVHVLRHRRQIVDFKAALRELRGRPRPRHADPQPMPARSRRARKPSALGSV